LTGLELKVWTDGSRTGNGALIHGHEGNVLRQIAAKLPDQIAGERELDHSDAEYLALILGLREASHLGATKVTLYCDSLFLVGHMNKIAQPGTPEMIRYNAQAVEAASGMDVKYVKIAGEDNPADGLSRMFPSK
jgi:ribonuclease HI